jgi:multidrug resistance efflux pump
VKTVSEQLTLEQRVEAAEARLAIISEGFNAILQELAKVGETVEAARQMPWNPSNIGWVETEGAKGKYQRYPAKGGKAESTADYKNMLADLKQHSGKLIRDSYFYWVFTDQATVGRKKTK